MSEKCASFDTVTSLKLEARNEVCYWVIKICFAHLINVNPVWFVRIGKGRGRQVIAVARTADLIIMMLDAVKGDVQRLAFWVVGGVFLCSQFLYCVSLTSLWLSLSDEACSWWAVELFRVLLEKELETVGIRLNKQKPNIYFKVLHLTLSLFCVMLCSHPVIVNDFHFLRMNYKYDLFFE